MCALTGTAPGGDGKRVSVLELRFPVETITDRVALLAASVWHLKDRLKKYAKVTKRHSDIEVWANGDRHLQICGDIGNQKKHGGNDNVSGLDPRVVAEVVFDTSRSGLLEFYYDGATNQRELLVSDAMPIPYRVDIADGMGAVIGDAATVIRAGFDHWLPLIDRLGVLAGEGPDDDALLRVLFPGKAL